LKKLMVIVVVFALMGCAAQGTQRAADDTQRQRAKIHTELAGAYYSRGEYAIALDEYREATRIDPSYAPAYSGLGLLHTALRQDDKAEANFKKSLQLDPESSESHNNYGTFLCARNRFDESITEFLTALSNPLYPTPESAYMNAGVCSLKKKDEKNAEAYLLKALQIQPGLRQASFHLANIYFSRGDFVSARKYLQHAMLNIDPTPEMLWLGVRIERVLGDKSAEASYALLLRKKYPDSEQTRIMLAE
jgi:type IV pilus assembly protein PilF